MNWFHKERSKFDLLEHIAESVDELVEIFAPRLTSITIVFIDDEGEIMGTTPTPPAPAAVTLSVGQMTIASIVGFDQNGAPFVGTIPTPSWSIDNPTFDSIAPDSTNPQSVDVTSLAVGVANLTVNVAGPNGTTLTATGVITNTPAVVQPVLTTVGIQFSTPK